MARREIRTPVDQSTLVELGNGVYRKQVLDHRKIKYGDRDITFDKAYCDNVARAFREQAFDTVPLVLADERNQHTMSPERARGEVLGMESDDTGLWATIRLSEDAAAVVEDNPKVGVSVRVKEDYTRPDGKGWPAACQHVLMTYDPKLTGLAPWQSVDLSADPEAELIDLTNSEEKGPGMTAPTETDTTDTDAGPGPEQSDQAEQFAAFQRWMDAGQPDPGDAPAGDEQDGQEGDESEGESGGEDGQDYGDDGEQVDIDGMSDDEFDAWWAEISEGTELEEPTEVAASNSGDALELSNGDDPRVVELSAANAALRARVDASEYEKEADDLVRKTGLPPHVIEMARPLLEGSGRTVSLSNGEEADAGQIIRNVLDEIGSLHKLLDLSEPQLAQLAPVTDEETEKAEERSKKATSFLKNAGL